MLGKILKKSTILSTIVPIFLIIIATNGKVDGTKVAGCSSNGETTRTFEDNGSVKVSGCTVPPCILKKRTSISIEQEFEPVRDINSLTTTVSALVFGVNLPFIGVTGTDACGLITNPDGSKAGCPLEKGKKYIYKNKFPVLPVYPPVAVTVHWALTEGKDNVACFEVPARITN